MPPGVRGLVRVYAGALAVSSSVRLQAAICEVWIAIRVPCEAAVSRATAAIMICLPGRPRTFRVRPGVRKAGVLHLASYIRGAAFPSIRSSEPVRRDPAPAPYRRVAGAPPA